MSQLIAVGERAPDFTLQDQGQNNVSLSSFQGEKNVILAFYPLDFSPVCSNEHTCFRDDLKNFEGLNAQVLGISVDSVWAHKAFAQQLRVSYPLLADFNPRGEVAAKFGLYLEDKGITQRATVVIDKQGFVRYVHVNEILQQRDNKEIEKALNQLD